MCENQSALNAHGGGRERKQGAFRSRQCAARFAPARGGWCDSLCCLLHFYYAAKFSCYVVRFAFVLVGAVYVFTMRQKLLGLRFRAGGGGEIVYIYFSSLFCGKIFRAMLLFALGWGGVLFRLVGIVFAR